MHRAVIAIVKGGLGNQLFIYAAARALALRTGRTLYLDATRGYTRDDYGRNYRLDRFPIEAEVMPEAWRIAPTLKHFRHKLIRAGSKLLPRNQRTYLAEHWHRPPTQLTALRPRRKRLTLLGYWQNEAYFADHAATIRAELTPPPPTDTQDQALGEKFATCESIFLHFRRVRYWNLLGSDYYQTAIDAALAKLPRPHFVLFGDDLNWPRQHLDFRGASQECVNHNSGDELADLWLMSRCRHAIVANSSFSWWGAWLGEAALPRLVFAPQQTGWPLVMPPRWQRIANVLDSSETGRPQ
ncbi:MAG TPA: alpha-1,2-fucosyltransferase [Verrucomicrobiota bacterium]|nr:alpha-1,2-fucosyltransferase [Verrucomicrobiota bacterium]HNT14529.1 alpha-1,2-fucosyltransferase [Verrucomicrobiota bacterium]